MKNLIKVIILVLLVWSCGSPSTNNSNYEIKDSIICPPEYVESSSSEQVAQIDSQKKTSRDNGKYALDTSQKRPFEMTQLDTTSLLPEIRRNKEIINQQQLALDSLLKKK